MPCTTILAGKNATYNGATMVARTEDSGAGAFCPKKFKAVLPEDQPRIYQSVISKVEIPLPEHPLRYTAMPNALADEGIWGAAGINEKNVGMTATETITSNERVLGADPMVTNGIGEEDMVTLVLPYIATAREGVLRLGNLLRQYGTYEKNGIAFHDENEVWWLETIGGHHWMARRVPDGQYAVIPNQLGLDCFDLVDAFGEQKNYLCSEDLREFIEDNHLNLGGELNPRDAFGSHSDSDHTYNTPRAWIVHRYLSRKQRVWDGDRADFTPASDDLPWSMTPDRRITIEDIKYCLSHHYQGTRYDMYGKNGEKPPFRPIGINRNNVLVLTEIRPDLPHTLRGVEWIAFGSSTFAAIAPFYTQVSKTPDYLANTTGLVSTDSLYWANRLLAALADAHFNENIAHIERYQMAVQSRGRALMLETDKRVLEGTLAPDAVEAVLEEANEKIAAMVKEETDKALSLVLKQSSNLMRNSFSRSDG